METDIGSLLREARVARSESLRTMATAIGLSPSLISQVETGKTQPSVSTLYAMTSHLGLSIDDLLDRQVPSSPPTIGRELPRLTFENPFRTVQRFEENPSLQMENGVRWERLAVGRDSVVEPLLVSYEPGAASSVEGKLMRHHGHEYAYILEGELTLQLEFEFFVLSEGDSLQFDSIRPHMYVNHGNVPARGIWYVVGRKENNSSDEPSSPIHFSTSQAPQDLASAVDVLQVLDSLRE